MADRKQRQQPHTGHNHEQSDQRGSHIKQSARLPGPAQQRNRSETPQGTRKARMRSGPTETAELASPGGFAARARIAAEDSIPDQRNSEGLYEMIDTEYGCREGERNKGMNNGLVPDRIHREREG